MLWKNHRDQLSVALLGAIFVMFIVDLVGRVYWGVGLPGEVVGAMISAMMLIVQFYWRKAGPGNGGVNDESK